MTKKNIPSPSFMVSFKMIRCVPESQEGHYCSGLLRPYTWHCAEARYAVALVVRQEGLDGATHGIN